ncbi:penicillin-binding protein 1B [Thalassotalea atypica]|uniref:penicillin-binding protein 1B n=1 Tax=Thalassotalea atypica TaxID=2054316 RepID=UPI0025724395|nr:penicillin-binding protein 1B [Thalassotalea atypica]
MTKKTTTTKKTASKAHSKTKAVAGNQSIVTKKKTLTRKALGLVVKLTLIVIFAIGIYTIYLDGKVRQRFEGERWQVPVQVFSQIINLQVGDKFDLNLTAQSLRYSGYQKVRKVFRPGQYALSTKRIIVYRRSFDSGQGEVGAAVITVDAHSGQITKLYQDEVSQQGVQLEPMLLDRIVPNNNEDRVLVALEQVPESLLDTLLLVEDRDFYFHSGISPLGILRALVTNIIAGRTVQGGSTLTQQLVKNMFLTREKTLIRKFNEALMSIILELRYSKDQLLEAYVNEVYLGQHYANGIYGFGLAANFYFGVDIEQLDAAQMATLIAQIKGPSYYDPWRHPKRATERRNLILRMMFEQHLIERAQFEQAVESPLSIRAKRRLAHQKFPGYMQLVKMELAEQLQEFSDVAGIKVFTGFSPTKQYLLEQTVEHQLKAIEQKYQHKDLQAAMMVTDIVTSEINAVVGDRNRHISGFNRVLNAKRHIGSLVKPAVYLPALEQYEHYNLATLIEDQPVVLKNDNGMEWRPKNYDGKFRGKVPMIDGLVHSLNVPTVNLGMSLGLGQVSQAIQMLGYEKEVVERPSMLLGAMNMSPLEINQLYLTLAKGGQYQQGHAITKIISSQGETLWEFSQQPEPRVSEQAMYLIDYALHQVTTTGTARSLTWRLKNKKLAGKTGTSNDLKDSWFIGYDEQQLVTTWVGFDNNKATKLTGSSGALVLFADYMKKSGVSNLNMEPPQTVAMTTFEAQTGNAVDETCLQMKQYPAIQTSLSYYQCLEKAEDKRNWFEKLFGD